MTSASIRDPVTDHLITPQNAALALIDYQPPQFSGVRSMGPGLLLKNIVSTVKTAKTSGLPIVDSTINVASGRESRPSPGGWSPALSPTSAPVGSSSSLFAGSSVPTCAATPTRPAWSLVTRPSPHDHGHPT
jgi:nicotinamidase-related amidase